MSAVIHKHRQPFESKLNEKLAVTDALLYRRGNFNGSFDQLILDALMHEEVFPSHCLRGSAGVLRCCQAPR